MLSSGRSRHASTGWGGLFPQPERYGFGLRLGKIDQLTRRLTLGRIRMTVVARTIRLACRYLACLNMALLPLFLLMLRPMRAALDGERSTTPWHR